jgi:hypothetical protein
VREVRQPGGPEDQRQPDRAHRDDQAELHAADEQLQRSLRGPGGLPGALTQHEQRRCDGARPDGDLALLAALLANRHALGQRLEVELDGVVAGAGQRDRELALGVGLGRRHLLASCSTTIVAPGTRSPALFKVPRTASPVCARAGAATASSASTRPASRTSPPAARPARPSGLRGRVPRGGAACWTAPGVIPTHAPLSLPGRCERPTTDRIDRDQGVAVGGALLNHVASITGPRKRDRCTTSGAFTRSERAWSPAVMISSRRGVSAGPARRR